MAFRAISHFWFSQSFRESPVVHTPVGCLRWTGMSMAGAEIGERPRDWDTRHEVSVATDVQMDEEALSRDKEAGEPWQGREGLQRGGLSAHHSV